MADKIQLKQGNAAAEVMKARERSAGGAMKLNEQGRSMVNQFFMMFKTVKVHEINNAAFERPLANLVNTINTLVAMEGRISMQAVEDQIYVNDFKIKPDASSYANLRWLAEEFHHRDVGGMQINSPVDSQSLKKFIMVFVRNDSLEKGTGIETLNKAISGEKLLAFMMTQVKFFQDDNAKDRKHLLDKKEYAVQTYSKAILSAKALMSSNMATQGAAHEKQKTQRLVQDLVDISADDNHTFLGLTTIKNHDEYLYNHSVNVCVMAISFGQKIGMSKRLCSDLGMAALFHDIGMMSLPLEILNKPGKFSSSEADVMKQHAIYSVKTLLKQKALNESMIRRILVAYEHHMDFNLGGYPRVARRRTLHLFSRIIQIVDAFDGMTTAKPYREAYLPDEALKVMLKESGTKFDPTLLKVFVNMIGVFPLGTFVQLDTGEMGLVFHNSNDPAKFERPRVKLVMDANGNKVPSRIVDLAEETATGSGDFKRSIVKSVDPTKYNLNVPSYLLA
jgi:HD-GYP domain-containing protein (c-di-GMP phosphodiesterase class II)